MADPKELLIVEDHEETAIFLAQILEDQGYRYRVARNGAEALITVRQRQPELVLLDLMMPRKSGLHVLQEMKSDPDLENIPILVVTGLSEAAGVDLYTGKEEPKEDEGDVVARRLGVVLGEKLQNLAPDGVIEKPIEPALLMDQIQALLS